MEQKIREEKKDGVNRREGKKKMRRREKRGGERGRYRKEKTGRDEYGKKEEDYGG